MNASASASRQSGSAVLITVITVAVISLIVIGTWNKFNARLNEQMNISARKIGRADSLSSLNLLTKLFADGTLEVTSRTTNQPRIAYKSGYTGQRWQISQAGPAQNQFVSMQFCHGADDIDQLLAGTASACSPSGSTVQIELLSFNDADNKLLVRAIVRRDGIVLSQQMANIFTLSFSTVPMLTCGYRLQYYDNSDHIYDQRGVVTDNGMQSDGRAVRWNIAKNQQDWTLNLTNVAIFLEFDQFPGQRFRVGQRIPADLNFSEPVMGHVITRIHNDVTSVLRSQRHDLRTYFLDDPIEGVSGSYSIYLSGTYTNISFKRCAREYSPSRVAAVNFISMRTYQFSWPPPF